MAQRMTYVSMDTPDPAGRLTRENDKVILAVASSTGRIREIELGRADFFQMYDDMTKAMKSLAIHGSL